MKQQNSKNQLIINLTARLFFVLLFALPIFAFGQSPSPTPDTSTAANLAATPIPLISETPMDIVEPVNALKKSANLIAENLIHYGDMIEVDVLGSLDYDWRGRTNDEGFLNALPELDVSIFALCRTENEIADEIAAAYAKFLRDPRVVVRVLDRSARQPAVLFGAVRTPLRFRIQRPVRLNELVVMSGGISELASGEVQILRPARVSCVANNQNQLESQLMRIKLSDLLSGKTEANPLVHSGDIVTVEEALPVYVTGGVVTPQRILFRQGLSLSRAVASAGGVSRNGDATKITVFRRGKSNADLEIIEADLGKILSKQIEDVALQPQDIVEVNLLGRAKKTRPPLVNALETTQFDINKLPVREIN